MIYKIFFVMMVVGYLGCSLSTNELKIKIIGLLITVVNIILFYK